MSYVSDLVRFKKRSYQVIGFSHLLAIVLIGAKFVFWELSMEDHKCHGNSNEAFHIEIGINTFVYKCVNL